MQGYMYSVFSASAIAIHLIINFRLLIGRGETLMRSRSYRGFLMGILAYYLTDAAWGMFAGLRWMGAWYVDTIFFFLSLVAFVFMWSRFVISYLDLGRKKAAVLIWFGYATLAVNVVALAVNSFNNCVFYFDADGVYKVGWMRDPAFFLLVAFNFLVAAMSFAKAMRSRDTFRRRGMMVFMFSIMMTAAMILQIIWPLTPFTALGCLIGNCFFHVFVIQDEQTAKHTAELEDALERAHAAEKARSMFFSIVSHDIRTPLNAILGYSELLQKGTMSQAERETSLKAICASGTTLLQLVNDVLDLAKMDAGKMTLRPEPVLLDQLTDEVFSSFWRDASEKGIRLDNRTGSVPTVMLDGHRFRQILFNLVGNAVKFTKRGAVTVAASYSGTTLEVSVSDTGCGIPPDMLTRILDPFVQVQDPSHAADRSGGTGLGLSICKRLVEVMGGELRADSEIGRGSAFTAVIPNVVVSTLKTEPVEGKGTSGALKNLPKHVLVVDDSSVNRSVLAALLKWIGVAAVDFAGDGVEALAALDSAEKNGIPYDFVFSDFWMPNMNGLEFIEKLRADSRFSRLRTFAVTADSEFRRDNRSSLFNGILLKPLTYKMLVDVFGCRS